MKRFAVVASGIGLLTGNAWATDVYEDYDSFYASQPRAVFTSSMKSESGVSYAVAGKPGIFTEHRARLDGRTIRLSVAVDRIAVDGKSYRFAHATTFPGEHPSNIYPLSAEVFMASRTDARPALVCLQGYSDGSGEAGRRTQIYLLIEPLAAKRKAAFLHLPGLLSSCRAVVATKDAKIAFPKNDYLFDNKHEARVGLLLSYYMFENRRFAATSSKVRLQFAEPEIPFRFFVQSRD
ncbi:hypothetical protein [Paraburkholderia rhizosphaerae]|uniref:Outer membrane lipoprotein-sorting protein n=1 Tax=Paraburkholderia rhizosphaerae TaxID=480658 RepID=A0A4R8L4W4_9BURK|nr:hypothetical protein [Paraburkholderia rhizosphaerae]TDY37009.1 hypothetical protein BX592_14812 [Paraburkholderia rhizosphaerae]